MSPMPASGCQGDYKFCELWLFYKWLLKKFRLDSSGSYTYAGLELEWEYSNVDLRY